MSPQHNLGMNYANACHIQVRPEFRGIDFSGGLARLLEAELSAWTSAATGLLSACAGIWGKWKAAREIENSANKQSVHIADAELPRMPIHRAHNRLWCTVQCTQVYNVGSDWLSEIVNEWEKSKRYCWTIIR